MKILNYNKKARAENHRKARNSKRTSPGDLTWTTTTARRGGGPRGAGLRLQRRRAPPAQGGEEGPPDAAAETAGHWTHSGEPTGFQAQRQIT